MSGGRASNSERERASGKRWREIDKITSRVLRLRRGELDFISLPGEDRKSKEQLIADLMKEFDRLIHEEAEAFPEKYKVFADGRKGTRSNVVPFPAQSRDRGRHD
jgi:hypothetical protein